MNEKKYFSKILIIVDFRGDQKFLEISKNHKKNSKNIDFGENFIESNHFRIVFYTCIPILSQIGRNFLFSKIFKIRKKNRNFEF